MLAVSVGEVGLLVSSVHSEPVTLLGITEMESCLHQSRQVVLQLFYWVIDKAKTIITDEKTSVKLQFMVLLFSHW